VASIEHQRPAGMWVRMMASLVDLLIATIVVVAVVALGELALHRSISGDVFQLAGYVLYGGALTARNGRTLGQWLFELEVVDVATGQRPSLRRAFLRIAVPTLPPLLAVAGKRWAPWSDAVVAVALAVPFLGLIWASLRSVNKQTYWDRISHTLVRYRTRRTTAF
jgi:uncharacterized RDD family membrane protein YckC